MDFKEEERERTRKIRLPVQPPISFLICLPHSVVQFLRWTGWKSRTRGGPPNLRSRKRRVLLQHFICITKCYHQTILLFHSLMLFLSVTHAMARAYSTFRNFQHHLIALLPKPLSAMVSTRTVSAMLKSISSSS